MMKNIAVVLAGGNGNRLKSNLPKQFLKVAGKTVIEHTIEVFEKHKRINEICIVSNANFINKTEEIVIANKFKKVKKILNGGKERYHSSLAAIHAYEGTEVNLIFHDAVRPLLGVQVVDDVIDALDHYNAVDVAIPSSDTIIQVNNSNEITNIPERHLLRRGQTPQGFRRSIIKEAYDKAIQDPNFLVTDDCGVVIKYLPNEKVFVVNGEQKNMKLTFKEDLFLLDKLFQLQSLSHKEYLTEVEKEEMANKVMVVFGGSLGIGREVCKEANKLNLKVYSFSRSQNCIDITNISDVKKALKEVYDMEGRIDYIINSAAELKRITLPTMNYEEIDSLINLNLRAMITVAKESFDYLKESKGQLVLYTSSSYTRGRALYSVYSCTKAAAVNLAQALAEEWEVDGVRVNCINPERTNTPMRVKNFGIEPLNSLLDPQKVAQATLKTIASNISGQVVDVRINNV